MTQPAPQTPGGPPPPPPEPSVWAKLKRLRERGSGSIWSPGVVIICLIAIISSGLVLARPGTDGQGEALEMWTFARNHFLLYEPVADEWNAHHPPAERVDVKLIAGDAMGRRMMSGFVSGTPVAELVEIEAAMAARVFAGPVEDIGLMDLTDVMKREGLLDAFVSPSLSPWTQHGRVFGLPHDVHPVLLAYRADVVEEAGIDVTQIETWADFERVMKPLVKDIDGDGRPDRYVLNIWPTGGMQVEALLLQDGEGYFDDKGRPILDSPQNARVLAQVVAWSGGPERIAADAPEFSASGNQARLEGFVVCSLMPDWLSGVWMQDLPGLAGKVKLMPLPAWEPGGRRTSVIGGSMLGIPKRTAADGRFEEAWAFAKELYTSPEIAERLYRTAGIVSPFRGLWDRPYYDEPVPFFSGQPAGRLYLDYAESVPRRTVSPFQSYASGRMNAALFAVFEYAKANDQWDAAALEPVAAEQLAQAQALVERQMDRNAFVRETMEEDEP